MGRYIYAYFTQDDRGVWEYDATSPLRRGDEEAAKTWVRFANRLDGHDEDDRPFCVSDVRVLMQIEESWIAADRDGDQALGSAWFSVMTAHPLYRYMGELCKFTWQRQARAEAKLAALGFDAEEQITDKVIIAELIRMAYPWVRKTDSVT